MLVKAWSDINPVSILLWPVSLLFCALVSLRRKLYRKHILHSWQAPVPVIVVGNISVGGTGKTPVVVALLAFLKASGWRPGVVSRGYGGSGGDAPKLVADEPEAFRVGDEPLLLHRRTACPVCVGADRSAAVRKLLQSSDCNVVVTDDGLQHYRLQRDFEIAVVDAGKMHGNGFCLPAGPLREPVSRLGSVDFVLFNRPTVVDDGRSFCLHPQALRSLDDTLSKPPEAFAGCDVYAVAGTASAGRFFATLESLGIRAEVKAFPDHHRFSAEDFAEQRGRPLIMTEKDAVKCTELGLSDAWYLPVTAELPETLQDKILQCLSDHTDNHES
ncbi:MAG: tetraacyldisaccharide 4'-kinase [Gammaproteobacteria bacterium]|nr:tetraacyldisaccharide 4'-kinase [Gammaproteobacteria bacterium]